MKVVHKQRLAGPWLQIAVPTNAFRALHVHDQGGCPTLWYETLEDTASVPMSVVSLITVGTGMQVPDGAEYVGTCHVLEMVWHVYVKRV